MNRKSIASAAFLAALASGSAAGLIGFGNSASAATDTSITTASAAATTSSSSSSAVTSSDPAVPAGPHQANGITETPLTGDDLAKATAAAAAAESGSTVVRAETDADGDAFEVHITKADGTKATVKLNADFTVRIVEADSGKGGHGGKGGAHGTETPLSGDDLAKATAAAAAAESGSTVVRAETDADGDAFEVHITKADGTKATVKLNADFTVRIVEASGK